MLKFMEIMATTFYKITIFLLWLNSISYIRKNNIFGDAFCKVLEKAQTSKVFLSFQISGKISEAEETVKHKIVERRSF